VTTICEGLKNDLIARGIDGRRITVVPNAVDVNAFAFGRQADGALACIARFVGAEVVGFAGSFYGYEGLDLLLDAASDSGAAASRIARPPRRRRPAGAGIAAAAAVLGIADRVIFTDGATRAGAAVLRADRRARLSRRSSRLTEIVTPLKPLEAMAQAGCSSRLTSADIGN